MPTCKVLMGAHDAAGGGLDHSHWGDPGDRVGGLCCGACILNSGTPAHHIHVGRSVLAAYSAVACLSACSLMDELLLWI